MASDCDWNGCGTNPMRTGVSFRGAPRVRLAAAEVCTACQRDRRQRVPELGWVAECDVVLRPQQIFERHERR